MSEETSRRVSREINSTSNQDLLCEATCDVTADTLKEYDRVPTPSYGTNKYRINITQLNLGYMVEVGCQTIAIESKERLKELFCLYMDYPAEMEKALLEQNRLLTIHDINKMYGTSKENTSFSL